MPWDYGIFRHCCKDRAYLILDNAIWINGPVLEVGQALLHIEQLNSELPPASSSDGVQHLFARRRMPAEGIRPHSGPGSFHEGSTGNKRSAFLIKYVAGKCQMERGVVVMDILL